MKIKSRKLALAGVLIALAVVGSILSFPVLASRCAPVQHMINVIAAVVLGPAYALAIAFLASAIRNVLGLGSLMAFPGSMFGALFAGVAFRLSKKIRWTLVAEIFGTAVLGGLTAYPVALFLMGKPAGQIALFTYIFPFFISTAVGASVAGLLLRSLMSAGILSGDVQLGKWSSL